jgi:hypothetical protein
MSICFHEIDFPGTRYCVRSTRIKIFGKEFQRMDSVHALTVRHTTCTTNEYDTGYCIPRRHTVRRPNSLMASGRQYYVYCVPKVQ